MQRDIYDEDHEAFREVVKEFLRRYATNEKREQWERDGEIDRATMLAAGEQGLIGLSVPEEFGGAGMLQDYRFRAIVTHASLWALDGFGPTTDAAFYWQREMTARMGEENSPHRFVEQIVTPMLVIHGDRDYRVPISEGLALWWALNEKHEGEPADLPHRFLYFPDENHWILSPQHAKVWYDTVIEFLAAHREGRAMETPELL